MAFGSIVSSSSEIVLFSEGALYRYTNEPLLRALSQKRSVLYLTLDARDPFLQNPLPNTTAQHLKAGFSAWYALSRLKAGLFITTTPGLNSLALKRSPHVKHYSYYLHSPGDMHWYQKYSFDSYDSICCSSPFQLKTLDAIEKTRIRGFSYLKEQRHVMGLLYYDHYASAYQNAAPAETGKTCVLIATNWGGNNYLNYLSYDIFEEFLKNGFEVIFRPHPQSFKADARLIGEVLAKHGANPAFSLDKDINIIPSLGRATVMVSSISGIIFDYALLTEKPSILIDFQRSAVAKQVAFEGDPLPFKPWEEDFFYGDIGLRLSADDASIVSKWSTVNGEAVKRKIQGHKKEILNFGEAAPKIAAHYLALAESLDV